MTSKGSLFVMYLRISCNPKGEKRQLNNNKKVQRKLAPYFRLLNSQKQGDANTQSERAWWRRQFHPEFVGTLWGQTLWMANW